MGSAASISYNSTDTNIGDGASTVEVNNNIQLVSGLKAQVEQLTEDITVRNTSINKLNSEINSLKFELEQNDINAFAQSLQGQLDSIKNEKAILENQLTICLDADSGSIQEIFKTFCIKHGLTEFYNLPSKISPATRYNLFSRVSQIYIFVKFGLNISSYELEWQPLEMAVQTLSDDEFLSYLNRSFQLHTI